MVTLAPNRLNLSAIISDGRDSPTIMILILIYFYVYKL